MPDIGGCTVLVTTLGNQLLVASFVLVVYHVYYMWCNRSHPPEVALDGLFCAYNMKLFVAACACAVLQGYCVGQYEGTLSACMRSV